jgi:hypothetical protein
MSIRHISFLSALVAITLVGTNVTILGQGKQLTTSGAKHHIGQHGTVCGMVAGGRYARSTRGNPTFLDLDQPYPNQRFSVIIWGENRSKFRNPEDNYRNKSICVTGRIGIYRGEPEIIASDPTQISLNAPQPKD